MKNKYLSTVDSAKTLALNCFSHLSHYDDRVVKRVIQVAHARNLAPQKKFSEVFSTPADRKAGYRLIENDTLVPDQLISSIRIAGKEKISSLNPKTIVVPQDSTWFTMPENRHVRGLGKVSDSRMRGFSLHTALGLSLEGVPQCILDIQHYIRSFEKPKKNRTHREIEEKESFRWLSTANEVINMLPDETSVIFVSDRESDIYDYISFLKSKEASFVIRVQHNRRVEGEEKYLVETVCHSKPLGRITLTIPKAHNRSERVVRATIQTTEVILHLRKGGPKIHRDRQPISLRVLRVVEDPGENVKDPVDWFLYTDQTIQTLSQAKEIIRIYTLRWRIEEFHLTLKSGMGVEDQRFESVEAILRWIYLSAPMAVKLLEIMLGSRESPKCTVSGILSESEIEATRLIIKRQTGRLPRKVTAEMVVKHIAFLGGWMGRRNDGPPGIRTFWKGWRQMQFLAQMLGETN